MTIVKDTVLIALYITINALAVFIVKHSRPGTVTFFDFAAVKTNDHSY